MKQVFVAITIVIAIAASVLEPDDKITINGKAHNFTQGVEKRVILHNGQRVSVNISPVKSKEFSEHGRFFVDFFGQSASLPQKKRMRIL